MHLKIIAMNRFLLVLIVLVVISTKGMGQIDSEPSLTYEGTLCAGESIYIYLKVGSNCPEMSVSGSSSWEFTEPPSSVSYSGDYKSCSATWSTLGTKTVKVTYSCSTGGGSKFINLPFDPQPSLSLKVTNTGTICQGNVVHLSVINALNVGPSPTYDYVVDGQVVYSGGATTFDYSTTNASGGNHSAYVSVTSSGGHCSAVANSSPVNFTITPTEEYKVSLIAPRSNCSPGTHASFTTTLYADVDYLYTTPVYEWHSDGNIVGSNTSRLDYTITSKTSIYCVVKENINGSHPCLVSSSISETAVLDNIPPSTPTVQIIAAKDSYCTGDVMSFSSTGSYLYGTPHYSWSINGNIVSHDPAFTLTATTPMPSNGNLMLEIGDLGGACLTTSGVDVSIPLKINTTPTVNTTLGSYVCSGNTYNLNPTSNVPTASFSWTQTSTNVSGSSDGSGATISQTLTKINEASSGSVYYTVKALATYTTLSNANYTCTSPGFLFTVDVNSKPSLPILSAGNVFNICGPGKIPLTAQPASDGTDVHWYDSQGTLIPGNPAKPYISSNSTFQAATYNSETQCESSKVQISALVKNMYTASLNSIITLEPLVDGFTPISDLTTQSPDSVSQKVQYFDGLGRHYQDVFVRNSPNKNDITQTSIYDAFGRDVQEYLPFTGGNNGCPKNDIIDVNGDYIGLAQDFYNNSSSKIAVDDKPYATTIYESSPLSRVLKKGAPGAVWQPLEGDAYSTNDKTIKRSYKTNTSADHVLYFKYDATSGKVIMPGSGTYYDDNQLAVTRTLDEHNNEVIEYVDLEGHMVCKKVQYGTDASSNALYASTYYVYDDFGSLVVVLPPEGVKAIVPSSN
jgi:hypothetical protein